MKYKTINSEKFNTPYSDAVEINDMVEFSGMLGNDKNGLVDGGFEEELHQIFKNLAAGLEHYNLASTNHSCFLFAGLNFLILSFSFS